MTHDDPVSELLWGPRPESIATRTLREPRGSSSFGQRDTWGSRATFIWDLASPTEPVAVRRRTIRSDGYRVTTDNGVEEGRTDRLPEIDMATSMPLEPEPNVEISGASWTARASGRTLSITSRQPDLLVDEAYSRLRRDLTEQEARRYLDQVPETATCADRATAHRARGRDLARFGFTAPAAAELERALELDPSLGFDPVQEARLFAAQGALEEGRALALAGDEASARARLRQALELNPALVMDPEGEIRRLGEARMEK